MAKGIHLAYSLTFMQLDGIESCLLKIPGFSRSVTVHLCCCFPGPNHMPMQGPGPGPNQPPNMPSGSMNMPPSSHGSMGGYNHTVPSSQGMPAQNQMNMTQGQPMGNYGPRPNMNMQPNQGSTAACCYYFFSIVLLFLFLLLLFYYSSVQQIFQQLFIFSLFLLGYRAHDAPAAPLPTVQYAPWWCWTALSRAAEPDGHDGPGEPRQPRHGTEADATIPTSATR